ncbi:hypothetical protein BDV19DRAFT_385337 [Aspergillus venezuelensis]
MGIHIDILGVDDDRIYTSNDPVKGIIAIKTGKGTRISDITVSLKGIVKTSVIEAGPAFIIGNDVPRVAQEEHEFLRISRTLFRCTNPQAAQQKLIHATGAHNLPFQLSLPSVQMLPGANQKPLPPSLSTSSTEKAAAAQVVYLMEVIVERPGKLQKNITIEKVLTFVPSYPFAILRSLHPSVRSAQAALHATNVPSNLNAQSIPILILEARLQSSILHIRQRIPLRLYVRVLSRRTTQPSSIVLNTLKINLHTLTNTRAVGQKRLWSSTLRLVDLVGMDQGFACPSDTESLSELHHNALNHLVLPSIDPSFSTANFEQRHLLKVEAEFSISAGKRKVRRPLFSLLGC